MTYKVVRRALCGVALKKGLRQMKKKSAANIILVITLLIGIGLLLYPSISEYINSKHVILSVEKRQMILSSLNNCRKN